jgi:hypothetical protein
MKVTSKRRNKENWKLDSKFPQQAIKLSANMNYTLIWRFQVSCINKVELLKDWFLNHKTRKLRTNWKSSKKNFIINRLLSIWMVTRRMKMIFRTAEIVSMKKDWPTSMSSKVSDIKWNLIIEFLAFHSFLGNYWCLLKQLKMKSLSY